MIKVKISKNIIRISGHAGYEDYGKDIVCASVSSIVYTTINGILNLNSNALKVIDDKELIIEVLSNDNNTFTLINSMISLLEDLEGQYPENIKISKGE